VPILAELQRRFGDAIVETHEQHGDVTAVVARDALLTVLAHCRDDAALAFDVLMDLTAVDYLKFPGREDGPRFEVVYHLYSIEHNHRLRLKVRIEEDDAYLVRLQTSCIWDTQTALARFGSSQSPDPERFCTRVSIYLTRRFRSLKGFELKCK